MKKITTLLYLVLLSSAVCAQEITLESFASGFSSPVDMKNAGDDRFFVVEQGGRIKILNADGTTNATPFLNISGLIGTGSEKGLLGLAFHPDYATNGYFYVNYTDTNGDTQVSRFEVSAGDPDVADPGSELPIIDYTQPFPNHNGGSLNFGPDGYLYISSGDGGSGGDPGNRAQNTELRLGKMLRIDVDNPGGGNNYGIPNDNPFFNDPPNAPEIWAYGLRNAWKFSFDSETGDIWIADVGQGAMEEINKQESTEAGLNYGWRCYEGTLPYNTTGCPDPGTLTFPIAEIPHPTSGSITGGYVYRGTTYNNMIGFYFAADFITGLIVTVGPAGNFTNLGTFGGNWSTFGEDINGELYIVNYNGNIFKIVGEELGIDDMEMGQVALYPNPAQDQITIEVSSGNLCTIEIVDLKGGILYAEETVPNNTHSVPVDTLASGIYLVRITSNKGTTIKKLVKR